MNTDEIEQELGSMQLSDSFFPTGIFATSNGLEYLFNQKKVNRISEIIEMIQINITQQIGPTDCVAIASTYDYVSKNDLNKINEIDNIIFSTKLIKEIREASVRSGVQLIKCMTEFLKDNKILNEYQKNIFENKIKGVFPVAFAISCNALKISKEKCMTMMIYGFTVSIVGAALRLGIIQHFEAQKIIHKIKPIISKIVKENSKKSYLEMFQFAPQMDIIQMEHEKMDSKMFIT